MTDIEFKPMTPELEEEIKVRLKAITRATIELEKKMTPTREQLQQPVTNFNRLLRFI